MTQEEKRAAYYKTPQRLHVYESSDKAKQIVQKSITIDTLFSGVVPIQWSTPQAPEFTGLTWFVRKYGEITSAFHGGTYIGYRTFLQLIPDHDFAVIVLTNSDRGVEAYPAVADAMVAIQPKAAKKDSQHPLPIRSFPLWWISCWRMGIPKKIVSNL